MAVENYSHVMHIVSSVVGTAARAASARSTRCARCCPRARCRARPRSARCRSSTSSSRSSAAATAARSAGSATPATSTPASTSAPSSSRTASRTCRPGGGTVADAKPDYEFRESEAKARAVLAGDRAGGRAARLAVTTDDIRASSRPRIVGATPPRGPKSSRGEPIVLHRVCGPFCLHGLLPNRHVGHLHDQSDPIRSVRVPEGARGDSHGPEEFLSLRRREPMVDVVYLVEHKHGRHSPSTFPQQALCVVLYLPGQP